MHTTLNLQILNVSCPAGMTEATCPVRQYLKSQNTLRPTINETLVEPTAVWNKAQEQQISVIITTMLDKCAKCRGCN